MRYRIHIIVFLLLVFLLPAAVFYLVNVTKESQSGSHKKYEPGAGRDAFNRTNKITIGFSVASYQEERWLTDRDIFISKCKELGADVIVQSANGDDELQITQCKKLLTQNVDVLVVIPQDSEKAASIVNEASKVDVPVIAYDRLIRNCRLSAYITYDNVKIGELQAQYAVKNVTKGNYILLGGAQTDYCAIQVREGQMKVLKPFVDKGAIKIVGIEWTKDWNPFEARKTVERVLMDNNNNVHAIVASNDGTAGGAIQALAERRRAGKVFVSGQDADLAGCQRIVEGTQSMTVYVPIKAEAEAAADTALKLAKGENFEGNCMTDNGEIAVKTVLLTPIAVDKSNIVDTVIKDGYQKFEDVFKNISKDKWPTQK